MSGNYSKECGRVKVEWETGRGELRAVKVGVRDGWAHNAYFVELPMSLDEAGDLHYLLGRALATARRE